MKKLFVSIILAMATFGATAGAQTSQSAFRDTRPNAMVSGGAYSGQELANKLTQGDGAHSSTMLQRDFAQHGITVTTLRSTTFTSGTVTKDGRVIVHGKTVATGAHSYGRSNMAGSHHVGNLYVRPTSVSFQQSSLPALVAMHNGRFRYAIIKSCGNLVTARPVAIVKPHRKAAVVTPQAAPVINITQTQTQSQTQSQPQPAPAQPTPTPLPQTGAGLTSLLGSGAILGATVYYRKGRRSLRDALYHQS